MSQNNLTALRAWMAEKELDALLINQVQNRSYLSGWFNEDTEGSGFLIVGQHQQSIMTHTLYSEAASQQAQGWQVMVPATRGFAENLSELARENNWQKIGFEGPSISFSEYEKLRLAGENIYTLVPFEETPVDRQRQVKQPHELALLRRAIAITDETFTRLCEWIQPGMSEKEVQWEITRLMVSLGAEGPSFESIVASGPHGSMPHAHPSERLIQRGELITIDMGARYKGYCADMTRTICLGEPAEARMQEVYDAVLDAMHTCERGLYAGISSRAADALARDVLARYGLAEYYIHSTGHGVGLQIHEEPGLSPHSAETESLPEGSVVTVEPGIYIPGWSGLRIEDCVLLRADGAEVLTQSPTTLVIQR